MVQTKPYKITAIKVGGGLLGRIFIFSMQKRRNKNSNGGRVKYPKLSMYMCEIIKDLKKLLILKKDYLQRAKKATGRHSEKWVA